MTTPENELVTTHVTDPVEGSPDLDMSAWFSPPLPVAACLTTVEAAITNTWGITNAEALAEMRAYEAGHAGEEIVVFADSERRFQFFFVAGGADRAALIEKTAIYKLRGCTWSACRDINASREAYQYTREQLDYISAESHELHGAASPWLDGAKVTSLTQAFKSIIARMRASNKVSAAEAKAHGQAVAAWSLQCQMLKIEAAKAIDAATEVWRALVNERKLLDEKIEAARLTLKQVRASHVAPPRPIRKA